jgi:hypothetical protein
MWVVNPRSCTEWPISERNISRNHKATSDLAVSVGTVGRRTLPADHHMQLSQPRHSDTVAILAPAFKH